MLPMLEIQGENIIGFHFHSSQLMNFIFRAILVKDKKPIPMSFDFTPESERERIKYLVSCLLLILIFLFNLFTMFSLSNRLGIDKTRFTWR